MENLGRVLLQILLRRSSIVLNCQPSWLKLSAKIEEKESTELSIQNSEKETKKKMNWAATTSFLYFYCYCCRCWSWVNGTRSGWRKITQKFTFYSQCDREPLYAAALSRHLCNKSTSIRVARRLSASADRARDRRGTLFSVLFSVLFFLHKQLFNK